MEPYIEPDYMDTYFEGPDLTRKLPINSEYINRPRTLNYPEQYESNEDLALHRYIGSGVTFVSLITENLLSHPFLVLRRQCQVNHISVHYHLVPFTLLPTIYHIHQHQGLTSLWKGLGSSLFVRGISLGTEDLLSKVTPWPKDINKHSTLKQFFQHTMLKCATFAIVTPFYSASFVETVQSEIASERPGILDVFKEGFIRLLNCGIPAKGRMLPIWALVLPSVTLGIAKYFLNLTVKGVVSRILRIRHRNRWEETGTLPKNINSPSAMENINVTASLFAVIISDVVFYPCETIIHRLHLQGTRTIVDNLDNGRSVLPILTNYSGAIDCYENCLAQEGIPGLYKGFGALILQYVAHFALIRLSYFVLSEVGSLLKSPVKRKLPQSPADNSPPAISNVGNTPQSYLLP